jgi:hypothetical protein
LKQNIINFYLLIFINLFNFVLIGNQADLVIFSYDRPMQLYALLQSCEQNITGLTSTSVIYRVSNTDYQTGYDLVVAKFPNVQFKLQQDPPNDFKPLVMQTVFTENQAEYVIFAVDDIIVKTPVNLSACIDLLQQTKAYTFLLRLGQNINYTYMLDKVTLPPAVNPVADHVNRYCFAKCAGDWRYPNNLDMSLYRKTDLYETFLKLNYKNPNQLEGVWAARADYKLTGLYFDNSKIVNLPLNLVNLSTNKFMASYTTQELLRLFLAGQVIDLSPFKDLEHHSAHIDYDLQFVTF